MSKDSKHKDAAAWVIGFVTGKEAACIEGADPDNGIDPYRRSTFDHPKAFLLTDPSRNNPGDIFPEEKGKLPTGFTNLEDAERFCELGRMAFENSFPQLDVPGQAEYYDKLDLYVNLALDGKMTPKQAMDKCAEEWEQITDAYGRENQTEFWRTRLQQGKKLGLYTE